MNADAFRQFYEYHFTENCKIWDTHIVALSQEQFTQPVEYSMDCAQPDRAYGGCG